MTLKTLLREPLLHFLGIGFGLFLLYSWVAPAGGREGRVVVSARSIGDIRTQYERLWGRPPTPDEFVTLVDTRVRNEILYREGLEMGLDRDDEVIKRRVRQKYDLIAEEENGGNAPTDANLSDYLMASPDRFRAPPVLSFQQVMVPLGDGDAATGGQVSTTLKALQGGVAPATLTGSWLLPARMDKVALDLVARDFGSRFAEALGTAPVGKWAGPYTSGFGSHLVRVIARTPAALPPLDAVRAQVAREWENDRRTSALEARWVELRKKYEVVVEELPATAQKP